MAEIDDGRSHRQRVQGGAADRVLEDLAGIVAEEQPLSTSTRLVTWGVMPSLWTMPRIASQPRKIAMNGTQSPRKRKKRPLSSATGMKMSRR